MRWRSCASYPQAEKLAAKVLPSEAIAAATKPKKGGKKGAAAAEKGWNWAEQREPAALLLLHALELDLGVLWERRATGLKWPTPFGDDRAPQSPARLPRGPGCDPGHSESPRGPTRRHTACVRAPSR